MIVDYHIHTYLCGHARGSLDDLVGSAIEKGLSEIGIADHIPLTHTVNPTLSMSSDQLPFYVEKVLELKERYSGRITVRLGIEADFHEPTLEKTVEMLDAHPFDYVIGSVHVVGDWQFDNPFTRDRFEDIDIDRFYLEYLGTQEDMVQTGLFDIVGHPDLPKKFGHRAGIDLADGYRELLEKMKKNRCCFEINTAGLRWPAGEIYPEPSFVRLAAELGVPVTLGSDSHCPEDIGKDFEPALALIKEAGYTEIATFDRRKMRLSPID